MLILFTAGTHRSCWWWLPIFEPSGRYDFFLFCMAVYDLNQSILRLFLLLLLLFIIFIILLLFIIDIFINVYILIHYKILLYLMMNGFTDDLMLWFPGYCISIQGICHIFVMKGVEWVHSNGRHLTDYLGVGRNFNYQDNIETDDWFISHDTIKFIVKKVNHCCFSGTALQTFSLRLLGGGLVQSPKRADLFAPQELPE